MNRIPFNKKLRNKIKIKSKRIKKKLIYLKTLNQIKSSLLNPNRILVKF